MHTGSAAPAETCAAKIVLKEGKNRFQMKIQENAAQTSPIGSNAFREFVPVKCAKMTPQKTQMNSRTRSPLQHLGFGSIL